jgi:predicted nucleotidyltransferase
MTTTGSVTVDDLRGIIDDVLRHISGKYLALMLFGSRARGDHLATSDVDVLQVVKEGPRSYSSDGFSVVAYTVEQLRSMAQSHSLFLLHLKIEGIILSDPEGVLGGILDSYTSWPSPHAIKSRVRRLAVVLDASVSDFEQYGLGLTRTARYLLRTSAYSCALESGQPLFALEAVAERLQDQDLLHWLPRLSQTDKDSNQLSYDRYLDLCRKLAQYVGELPRNPHGSLEALVVNSWDEQPGIAALALQVIAGQVQIDYTTLPAPIL